MRIAFAALAGLVVMSVPSHAGPCDDLVSTARSALAMEGIDAETRNQLEEMLRAGQSGDPMQCEQMTGTIFQSSPEGERAKSIHRCENDDNTV